MLAIGSTYHRPASIPARLTGALVAGLIALAFSAGAAASAHAADGATAAQAAPAAQTLVIAGAGDGHGVGMSQDGALGYARHGYGYEAILAHYYTGTAIGQAPANAIVR